MKKRKGKKKDPIEVRWRLLVPKRDAATMTQAKFNRIYAHWVETGELPPSYRLAGDPEWRNPARPGAGADWRSGDPTEARETLLKRFLPATYFKISRVGRG